MFTVFLVIIIITFSPRVGVSDKDLFEEGFVRNLQ